MIYNVSKRDKHNIFNSITKEEHTITKLLLDLFDIDYGIEGEIEYQYCNIYTNSKMLAYCNSYLDLYKLSKNPNLFIFRPLKIEKHANILIKMFEDLEFIDFDNIEIHERQVDNGKTKYSGCLMKNGEPVNGSFIATAPSELMLKISIIANMMMDEETHNVYYKNLLKFLKKK